MSDASRTETTQSGQKRKIPKIVFDRKPLKDTRLLLALAIGMGAGVLLGGGFWLLQRRGENDGFPKQLIAPEQEPYIWAFVFLGAVAGFIFGYGYGRETEARIEKVDAPEPTRRRQTTTALARLDVSGRSRW